MPKEGRERTCCCSSIDEKNVAEDYFMHMVVWVYLTHGTSKNARTSD